MPNIREYTSPISTIQPSEGAPQVVSRAAGRIGLLSREEAAATERQGALLAQNLNSIGRGLKAVGQDVSDYQAGREINAFTDSLVKTHEQLDQDWAKTRANTDLNQPAAKDWMENTAIPTLDKLAEGMSTKKGREHAQAMVASAKLHYSTSTLADDSAAAGDAAVRNVENVANGATLRSSRDFSSVEYNGSLIRETIEGAIKSGNFKPAEQIHLRNMGDKLVKENTLAGLKGAAERNPGQFTADLEAGKFDSMGIDAKEKDALQKYAKMEERTKKADAINAQFASDMASRKESLSVQNKIYNDMAQPDGTMKLPSMQDVLNNKRMLPEHKMETIRFINGISKEPATRDDVTTYQDLRGRVGSPTNPTSTEDIADAVDAKKLTPKTAMGLTNQIIAQSDDTAKQWNNGVKQAQQAIRESLRIDSINKNFPAGTPYQNQAAAQHLDDQFREARRQGIPLHDLLDPASKYFYLKDPGLQQILKDVKPFQLNNIKPGEAAPLTPPALGSGTQKPAPTKGGKSLSDILDGK